MLGLTKTWICGSKSKPYLPQVKDTLEVAFSQNQIRAESPSGAAV
jgi:hypothetical protein